MAEQTLLRVKTNVPGPITTGTTTLSVIDTFNITYSGNGTQSSPFTGTSTGNTWYVQFLNTGGTGQFYHTVILPTFTGTSQFFDSRYIQVEIDHPNDPTSGLTYNEGFSEYDVNISGQSFQILNGDKIKIIGNVSGRTGSTFSCYVVANEAQPSTTIETYDFLDLYDDIPIKLSKSFSEIQDISKRNSDYSIGLNLPGSKRNNRFFEHFYNVDADSLFFDVTKRVEVDILIDNEVYFKGYLRLNKVSVINDKVEYDVTLYSTIADLFGKIGNNLLQDLNYDDIDYHFNHHLSVFNVLSQWNSDNLLKKSSVPNLWFYPVVHNGYEYSGDTVNLSGGTSYDQTRLYTSTVSSGYTNYAAFTSAGGKEYRINSPKLPILDNQLKPAISVWGIIQLMFKTYGYKIKSDFFNTPWFKLLYTYGLYSSDKTKLGYKITEIEQLPLEGVDIVLGQTQNSGTSNPSVSIYVTKKGTGIPCYCTSPINYNLFFRYIGINLPVSGVINAYTSGTTVNSNVTGYFFNLSSPNVSIGNFLKYLPTNVGGSVNYLDGDYINFSELIDEQFKQIDFLSSIAKKFNLLFIPDPDVKNQIIIEPYDYYIGTGQILDWTNKLSYDRGFTVQPALNFIESELIMTDSEDNDEGNKQFKSRNNRIYGELKQTNPTDFKSQTKKIDTIFGPELIRRWDDRIGLPLGINYVEQSQTSSSGDSERVIWTYKGIKSKPKLMFYLGNFSPFLNQKGEAYTNTFVNTNYFRVSKSDGTNPNFGGTNEFAIGTNLSPVISHTMPMGNKDNNKSIDKGFENDSLCILFNSEEPADIGLGIPTFNAYTENDCYSRFYANRIANLYNKNTRFFEGNFDLTLSDVKNLRYNDIIKIKEQYFYLNKLDNFNVTSPELTKVELVQTNINVTSLPYPTRYFKYQYCGDSRIFKFRTFFNPSENPSQYGAENNSIRRTYFYWSVLYDYMIGILGGEATGYTSSYQRTNLQVFSYTISEITETEYNNSLNYKFWYEDANNTYFIDRDVDFPIFDSVNGVYIYANQSGLEYTRTLFNLATGCTEFSGYCSSNNITISTPPGFNPIVTYTSGATLNVTDTGWIKYTNKTGSTIYKQITSLGTYTITDCIDCTTIMVGIPFADLANFTVTNCGNSC